MPESRVSLFDRIRRVIRGFPAYVAVRRWQKEGFLKAFRREQLWRRILATPAVKTRPRSASAVEVHTLCYRLDYLTAIWALKSFYRNAAVDWPLVIHVSGVAKPLVFRRLRAHFPGATIISQPEADEIVNRRLSEGGLVRLAAARRASPFMLKLTDYPLLCEGATLLGIDSDVLFFARPEELLDRCSKPGGSYLFQRDPVSTYNISAEHAQQQFGINLAPRVNTGIMVYQRGLPDLAAFERYLADPGVAVPNGFIEQTLYALHASAVGSVAYLPDTYAVDLRAGLPYDGLIARHYAGATRPLLTAEGMPWVLRSTNLAAASQ